MKFDTFNNDTVAIIFLGAVAVIGAVAGISEITNVALGALAGYIGAKANK